jgi:predicted nucleic acid-binding protein
LALEALEADMSNAFNVVEFSDALMARSNELAKIHALRAADAIQLACALESRPEHSNEYYLVSADDELNAAAVAEGLQVENPNLHP